MDDVVLIGSGTVREVGNYKEILYCKETRMEVN